MQKEITVIIPAHNEENNIGQVISNIKNNNNVSEIIVVDNASTDKTAEIAKEYDVNLVFCEEQGKGYTMEKGLEYAKNEIIVFLDADVKYYEKNIIDILTKPIIQEDIEFVKSTFDRIDGGVVTKLVVKPMLDILFPKMYKYSEPLSGMIAVKRDLIKKVCFEKDYGVDIGILLDVIKMDAKVKEVNIGKLENLSHLGKTTCTMEKMSREVIQTILKRAK